MDKSRPAKIGVLFVQFQGIFSRKKMVNRSKLNQSMISNDFGSRLESGAILAASRKNKRKSSRNQRSNRAGSRFKLPDQYHSRRSNSVSTHRTKRSNSSRKRSTNKFKLRKLNKSGSNLKGNRYIKNILPIVAKDEMRGVIANNFDSRKSSKS